jgi:transcriptional regulator with XRE-family HTH domain
VTFAGKLQELRHQASLSIPALARKASLHRSALHRLEQGTRQPSLEVAARLAQALGHRLRVWEECFARDD